jgi:tRNA G18 (ribose-2'-O)-methylase SpoU
MAPATLVSMSVPKVIPVSDLADPRLADYANLTDVELRTRLEPAQGLFMAEGARVIERALASGCRPRSVLVDANRADQALSVLRAVPSPAARDSVAVFVAPAALIATVTGYRVHRGFLAAMHRPRPRPVEAVLDGAARILVLEDLVDHTNVGAAFRSAAALGFDAVLLSPRCADPLYRRSIKVSMGAVLTMPWASATPWPAALDALRAEGVVVAALTPGPTARDLAEVAASAPARIALLVGTEGEGLTASALERADFAVRIPMFAGVDSLNAAAAAAVACYALGPASTSDSGAAAGSTGLANFP